MVILPSFCVCDDNAHYERFARDSRKKQKERDVVSWKIFMINVFDLFENQLLDALKLFVSSVKNELLTEYVALSSCGVFEVVSRLAAVRLIDRHIDEIRWSDR